MQSCKPAKHDAVKYLMDAAAPVRLEMCSVAGNSA